ncbi:hypothetical protein KBY27_21280 [Ruegeria pomeroyi]|uniref:Lipoprotein n=1 Tax=Ruegeria pomeroyi TaxID=89184 RepID=A0A9Q3ZSU3_9RHOB|nr:I78 family peptidase inhibitor [Ruegeria pomeroyi]MCE8519122.1 hypothetical protein [Ruegeria pomeroyi]MCE8540002.1 hypothetical protein [Ruegeria pomeroyi]
MYRFTPIFLLLAACADTVEEPRAAEPAPVDLSFCKGDDLGDIVGQPVATVSHLLPEGARVIGPDSLVTQDYRPNRLNVSTDKAGLVTRLSCG